MNSNSWILPGRANDPVNRFKAILETSFAYSRTFNSRNIEFHWYSLWAQTLTDLVADVTNLIVTPQFPVWFVPEDDEQEDEDDGDDPEMIVELEEQSQADGDYEEEEGDGAGNTSMASDAPTVPEKDAKYVLVDFVILRLEAVAQSEPEWEIRYGGWRITTANIGLLVEVKRFPSRSLQGPEQNAQILAWIKEASIDLIEQAAHLFIQDQKRVVVLALAAAGPYWRSASIYRDNVYEVMDLIEAKDPSFKPRHEKHRNKEPRWNAILRVDIAESRDRLHEIYNTLKEDGVLELPADV